MPPDSSSEPGSLTSEPELLVSERAFADALAADRPLTGTSFPGALGRHLIDRDPGYGTRPTDLRRTVVLLLAGTLLLLALGLWQARD